VGNTARQCSLLARGKTDPDPRCMALHKMWLSRQPKRHPEKRRKDARQGALLLTAVAERMSRFPLDKEFESKIPEALQPIYAEWQRVTLKFMYLGT